MNALKRVLTSKLFLTGVCLLGLYTVTGFFLLPYLVRHFGPRVVLEQAKKQVAIGEIRLNPFLFTLEVHDFNLAEADGERLISFARFFCDFELKSITERAWTFRQIAVNEPLINAVLAADGSLNLARLAPPSQPPAATEQQKGLVPLIVQEISIDQAQIDLTDRRPSKPATVRYRPLHIALTNLTTLPGRDGHLTLTAKGGDGENIRLDGRFGLSPVQAKGNVTVDGLRLTTLFQFVRDAVALAPPQGKLSVRTQYRLAANTNGTQATLSGLDVVLDDLALKGEEAESPFFELSGLKVAGGSIDLARQRVEVKTVTASGARARLTVDEKGLLNVGGLVRASADAETQGATAPARDGGAPWTVAVAGFALDGLAVEYRDQSRTPELRAAIGAIKAGCKVEAEISGSGLSGAVSDIGVQAADLQAALADQEKPLFSLDRIGLEGGGLDLASKAFVADKVAVQGGRVDVVRRADGAINLTELIPPSPDKTGAAEKAGDSQDDAAPPAPFSIKTVAVSGLDVALSDLALKKKSPALALRDIALSLSDVDGKSPISFDLALKIEEGGQVTSAGTINPAGPAVEAKVGVEALNLVPAQPYLSRMAAISLKSGTISSKGKVRFGCEDSAATETCLTYQGGLAVDRFRFTAEGGEETLVGWESLRTERLKWELSPGSLEIGDLKITEPTGKIVIAKDRSLNLAKLVKTDRQGKKPAVATPGEEAAPFAYGVRRILVNKGKVDFADFSLITPFGTKIHEVNGAVTGISSKKDSRAQVKLEGWVDDYGTAKVKGELDTSSPTSFTDIDLTFRNVEMARLTPYSGKFAGRQIKSGKLSVDLKYKINQGELAGDNQIKVERLTLGDRVESPNAVDLPLDLAIALLEDSQGVIDLGLPVRGNLNSPQFSIGAIVGKALASMLIKIVTSPFRILGALLPDLGGEATLNAVAFEAGRTDIPPPEKEKLAKLAQALHKRPQLKLAVTGTYSPATDKAVLQAEHVSHALAGILRQEGEADAGPEAIDLTNPETEDGLITLFKERFGAEAYKAVQAEIKAERKAAKERAKAALAAADKPGAAKGEEEPGRLAKLLFARLSEGEKVADHELAKLADDRARAVINELVNAGKLQPERLAAKPAKGLDPKAPIAAELNLEASR